MQQIYGTIKNVVYQNKENGYTVLRTNKNRTLCGTLYDTSVNLTDAEFIAKGIWQKHKKFGYQFHFESLTINESELFYFLSRIVKGIGRKLAKHLIETYGEKELETILDNNPKELITVKGIKHKKLKKITSNWNKFKDLKSLAQTLLPYGATQAIVNKVYRHFKENSKISDEIKENPYIITEVKGIGFKTADKISRAMGIPPHSLYRLKACINYILMDYTTSQGNSCIKKDLLYKLLNEEIAITEEDEKKTNLSNEQFKQVIAEMEEGKNIVSLNDDKITSSFLYYAEKLILDTAKGKGSLKSIPIAKNIDNYISFKEKEMRILFSEEQKQVIKLANNGHNLFILCGYAGTGKSVISKAILDLLSKRYSKDFLMCCALSGIASDRIRKTSGYQAGTVQSLLVKAEKDQDKLPYKVILLDETSMVNSEILYKLFKVSNADTLFVLVGDPAQLPPIGAGDPFHDIINKKIVPVVELTKIYRQSEDKAITYFANQIRQARVPESYKRKYDDFEYIDVSIDNYFALKKKLKERELRQLREENTQKILQCISQKALGYRNNLQHFLKIRDIINFVTYFQLITPVKNGVLGVDNLNIQLQDILNAQPDSRKLIDLGLVKFHLFDKVVHITNQDMDCYRPQDFKDKNRDEKIQRKRILNGMIGVLFQIDHKEELLWVFYPNDSLVVEYTFDEARDLLRLAYALTIHKTQGSEFRNVIIPMSYSHFIMLNNKLLYTAVTRAKEKCTIIGESYAFISACKRKDVVIRDTVMKQLEN